MMIDSIRAQSYSIIRRGGIAVLWLSAVLLFIHSDLSAQVIYGTTRTGGATGGGTIFRTYTDGTGLQTEYSFQIANPGRSADYCQMLLANGKLYGVTPNGGKNDVGVLYEFNPVGAQYTVKWNFEFATGQSPIGSLVLSADGTKLYGMTSAGGSKFVGVIFEYDLTTSTYTKKFDFDPTPSGASPTGGLTAVTRNSKNLLYGMTSRGGTNNFGVLFEYEPSTNTFVKKFDFDGVFHGSIPVRNLTLAPNGKLYGMTSYGGAGDFGTLFEYDPAITTNAALTTKVTFSVVGGYRPVGSLVLASATTFYGATNLGGTKDQGVLFQYTIGATDIANLYYFDATTSGGGPGPALALVGGTIYGTTEYGGLNGEGTLYSYSGAVFTTLFNFAGIPGARPKGGLTVVGTSLYGTCSAGGQTESGKIFSYDPTRADPNKYLTAIEFNIANNGAYPENNLVQAPNGKLYGVTSDGGSYGWGVIFEYDPIAKTYSRKVDFDDATNKGANPFGTMALFNGKLYGTTFSGGTNNGGTIFEYVPGAITLTKKVDLSPNVGYSPFGGLVLHPNGLFYGMTHNGGVATRGTIFSYLPGTTTATKLLELDGANGFYPFGNLAVAPNANLYGMTSEGGSNFGTLFELNLTGNVLTPKFNFDNNNGLNPTGSLLLVNDKFYGTTNWGGAQGQGVLFQYDYHSGAFTKKADMNGIIGPYGALVASGSKLYGTTAFGGTGFYGSVFEYDTITSAITTKQNFSGPNGAGPGYGAMIVVTLPPAISSMNPASGPVGSQVTINGDNFDLSPANNIVYFGATKATVSSATRTQLVVTVPTGATYQPLSVTVNGLTGYSSSPFLVTFASSGVIDATSFAARVDVASTIGVNVIALGDMNGDGKPDIVTADNATGTVSVFKNDNVAGSILAASLTKVDVATVVGDPWGVAVGDLDGDGKLDIVAAQQSGAKVSILRNTTVGTLSFVLGSQTLTTGTNSFMIAVGDLDGDGKPDLVVTNAASNTVSTFRNVSSIGNISFSTAVNFSTGAASTPLGLAIGDVDADGRPDVVVSNNNSNSVGVLKNTSTLGAISLATSVVFAASPSPFHVAIGDITGDGKPELMVANSNSSPPTVSVFRNTSSFNIINASSFAAKADLATATPANGVGLGDFNGDGSPDVVAPNNSKASVFWNKTTPAAAFTGTSVDFTVGSNPTTPLSADIDGDGRVDLLILNHNASATISVLRNTTPFVPHIDSFSPLFGPAGTSVIIKGSNFDPVLANNTVYFGPALATVTAASTTSMTVTVPKGATYDPIAVVVNGYSSSSAAQFDLTYTTTGAIDRFPDQTDFHASDETLLGALADFNQDGKSDLVVSNIGGDNKIYLFTNTATSGVINSSSLSSAQGITVATNPHELAVGDLDGDGKLDLVVTCESDNNVHVLRNNSTSSVSFVSQVSLPVGVAQSGAAIYDVDGDGKPEIITGNANGTISIFKNNSTKGSLLLTSFTRVDFTVGAGTSTIQGIAFGDLDGDGKPEMVAPDFNGHVSVFKNIGVRGIISTSTFSAKVDFAVADLLSRGVSLDDIDGDGKLDIVAAAETQSLQSTVSILRNVTTPGVINTASFDTSGRVDLVVPQAGGLAVGDVDGDGKPEILITNMLASSQGAVLIFKNESTPGVITTSTLTETDISTGDGPNDVLLGDIDGDGLPDLTVLNLTGSEISVYRNINDTTAPVISTPTPVKVDFPVSNDVNISVTVTDAESEVYNVQIAYGPANVDGYVAGHDMTRAGNVWSFSVAKEQFKDSGLQFEIDAHSGGGDTYETYRIGVTHSTDLAIPYNSPGTDVSNYRIVAVPLDLESKTVNSVFADDIAGTGGTYGDKTLWRMYRWTGSNNELNGTSTIEPGKGYWLICSTFNNNISTGKGTTVGSVYAPAKVDVKAGWNQIGNPYTFKLAFDDIVNYPENVDIGVGSPKTYDGNFKTDEDYLEVYQGAFVMIDTDGTLTFPAAKDTSIPGNGRTKTKESSRNKSPLSSSNWELMLNLKDSKHSLNFAGIGMHPDASPGYDKWDDFTVPRFLEYIELDHAKKLHGAFYTKDVVPTAGDYEWIFDVESSQEGAVEMSWDNTYFGDNDKQLILFDVKQQIAINMREQNKYTINLSAGKSFKLFYGGKEYVKEKARVDKMLFHSVFPNPAPGKVTFAFTTTAHPDDKWITLEVVDMLGRKIGTITEGAYEPGYHEISWEPNDGTGSRLPEGMYVTRLKNGTSEIAKKIVLK